MRKPVSQLLVTIAHPSSSVMVKVSQWEAWEPQQCRSVSSKVMYLHFPPWKFGFHHSCGFSHLILKSLSLIRNCPAVAFAQLQGQQACLLLFSVSGAHVALALALWCCSQHRSGLDCAGTKPQQESEQAAAVKRCLCQKMAIVQEFDCLDQPV